MQFELGVQRCLVALSAVLVIGLSDAKCAGTGSQCLRNMLQVDGSTSSQDGVAQPEALPRRFPFVASLSSPNDGQNYCNGALIGPGLVVTAAQCVTDNFFPDVYLLSATTGLPQAYKTCRTIIHEAFEGDSKGDIALLILAQDAESGIVRESQPFAPRIARPQSMLGLQWPGGSSNGKLEQPLEALDVEVVADKKCLQKLETDDIRSMICGKNVQETACHGVVGGPLVEPGRFDGEVDELVGILSLVNCEGQSVYTSIGEMAGWISTLGTDLSTEHENSKCKADKEEEGQPKNRGGRLPIVLDEPPALDKILSHIEDGDFKSAASLIVLASLSKTGPGILGELVRKSITKDNVVIAARAFIFALDGLEELLGHSMDALTQELTKQDISSKIENGELPEAAEKVAAFTKVDEKDVPSILKQVATDEVEEGRAADMGYVLLKAIQLHDGDEDILTPAIDVVLDGL